MVDDYSSGEQGSLVPEAERAPIVDGTQTYQHREARWLHLFLYIITALIFAFFLVLAGRWAYHKVHHTAPAEVVPAGNSVPAAPSTKNPSNSGSASTKTNPQSGSGTGSATNSSSPSSTSAQAQSAQLPNNGPGNMLGVFIGTSFAVGGAHYVITRRKAQKLV